MYYHNSRLERKCVNQLIDIRDEEENDFDPIGDKVRMTHFFDQHQILQLQQQQPDQILNSSDSRGDTNEKTPSVKECEEQPLPEKSLVITSYRQSSKTNYSSSEKQDEEPPKKNFTRKFSAINKLVSTPVNSACSPKVQVNTFEIISNYFSSGLVREELNKSLLNKKNIASFGKVYKTNESMLKNSLFDKKIQVVQKPAIQIGFKNQNYIRNHFSNFTEQKFIIKSQDNIVNRIINKKQFENKKKSLLQKSNSQANILKQINALKVKIYANRTPVYKVYDVINIIYSVNLVKNQYIHNTFDEKFSSQTLALTNFIFISKYQYNQNIHFWQEQRCIVLLKKLMRFLYVNQMDESFVSK